MGKLSHYYCWYCWIAVSPWVSQLCSHCHKEYSSQIIIFFLISQILQFCYFLVSYSFSVDPVILVFALTQPSSPIISISKFSETLICCIQVWKYMLLIHIMQRIWDWVIASEIRDNECLSFWRRTVKLWSFICCLKTWHSQCMPFLGSFPWIKTPKFWPSFYLTRENMQFVQETSHVTLQVFFNWYILSALLHFLFPFTCCIFFSNAFLAVPHKCLNKYSNSVVSVDLKFSCISSKCEENLLISLLTVIHGNPAQWMNGLDHLFRL